MPYFTADLTKPLKMGGIQLHPQLNPPEMPVKF